MKAYSRVGWIDHVEDVVTGEVIQEGTLLSQNTLGHMDDGIANVTDAVVAMDVQIAALQSEVKTLKDATLNNMVNNVFLQRFDTVDSVAITSGVYDPVAKKIYV